MPDNCTVTPANGNPVASSYASPAMTLRVTACGATMAMVFDASVWLAEKSRAMAETVTVLPAAACGGTTYESEKGSTVCAGSAAASTANVTSTTPTSSVAVAVTVTRSPGSACDGPSSESAGGVVSADAAIDIVALSSATLPATSVARATSGTLVPGCASAATVNVAVNGGALARPTWAPAARNTTSATPLSSLTRAESSTGEPGAEVGGASSSTAGGVVSGTALTVTAASAEALLPAASKAAAFTTTCWSGAATAGSVTCRSYGAAATSSGAPASTVKRTTLTPTLSEALAVKVTVVPGSACAGPVSVITGGVLSEAGSMTIERVAVPGAPWGSLTVSATVKVPASGYVNEGVDDEALLPATPKSHAYVSGSLSGSADPRPSNETATPTVPRVAPVMTAVGGRLAGGVAQTVTVCDAVALPPRPSLTVSVTVKVPGVANAWPTCAPAPSMPSPKLHANDSGSPSGSVEADASKDTVASTSDEVVDAVKFAVGGRFGCAPTMTSCANSVEAPRLSVTVRRTRYVPGCAKTRDTCAPLTGASSAKTHEKVIASPSGSLEALASNDADSPATGLAGVMVKVAVGGRLGGGDTVTVFVSVVTPPRPSSTVRVTVNAPAAGNVRVTTTPVAGSSVSKVQA